MSDGRKLDFVEDEGYQDGYNGRPKGASFHYVPVDDLWGAYVRGYDFGNKMLAAEEKRICL